MSPEELPVLSAVFEAGADDRLLDGLLLVGPVIVLAVLLIGRSVATEALAAAYLLAVAAVVLYRAIGG